ncbi:hypothetical protein Ae201684P_014548 [Aphanomyces euteiches]|uniref:Uncharacterized protein n=1 Tax=Aphanomyces euteiches TaxID=100861 RepID=A0A6G0W4Q4_9STRA|nr:hypothetical protein Ae201684_018742 [Aphanomyces euteiches]KAH9095482.1 hypothetical protein Ae201684P_014548 [Aphanomyces euteiches]
MSGKAAIARHGLMGCLSPAVVNYTSATNIVQEVVANVVGVAKVSEEGLPRCGAEDFAYYLEQYVISFNVWGYEFGSNWTKYGRQAEMWQFFLLLSSVWFCTF